MTRWWSAPGRMDSPRRSRWRRPGARSWSTRPLRRSAAARARKELTLPGFRHDVCSAIHPLGVASPFFRSLPLDRYGLEWVYPPAPLAHPLDDGAAGPRALPRRNGGVARQTRRLRLARPLRALVEEWDGLAQGILGPLRPGFQFTHPLISLQMARFAVQRPAAGAYARRADVSRGTRSRALWRDGRARDAAAGAAVTAAIALVLGTLGHSSAGRSRKVGRRRLWRRWRRTCARSAARSSPASR